MQGHRSRYRAGDWVEVRSREEILSTLDANGELEQLPFMPEMLRQCGGRFQVESSAHKTCDTVNRTGGRRMRAAVHLKELRCDGAAHDGCQARCLIFWKDAWLKPAAPAAGDPDPSAPADAADPASRMLQPLTQRRRAGAAEPVYVCQATRLFDATTTLSPWNPLQYVEDVASRNVPPGEAAKVIVLALIYGLRRLRWGFRLTRWLYDRAHRALRGRAPPQGTGSIPAGTKTPHELLDLEVGECVRVKAHGALLDTLDTRSRNRGMYFDKEMVRYCGSTMRVAARVTHFIDESTGKMVRLPNPSVTLEGSYCTGQYSERRLLCPRRIVPYWREIWLERATPPGPDQGQTERGAEAPPA